MADQFSNYSAGIVAPAMGGAIVVLDTAFTYPSRGIWVGGAGNVSALLSNGDTVILIGVLAGTLLPLRATKITTSGTSATNMVALW